MRLSRDGALRDVQEVVKKVRAAGSSQPDARIGKVILVAADAIEAGIAKGDRKLLSLAYRILRAVAET